LDTRSDVGFKASKVQHKFEVGSVRICVLNFRSLRSILIEYKPVTSTWYLSWSGGA
jgi:hypothetical protein